MNLYIDVGNTNLKVNFKGKYWIKPIKELIEKRDFIAYFQDLIANSPQKIYIASVVNQQFNHTLAEVLESMWKISPVFIDLKTENKVDFSIRKDLILGADLVALAVYLNDKSANGIMVNLGTTTTLTHVENGKFKGAVICPGLATIKSALLDNAQLINKNIKLSITSKSIGTTTEEALSIGILEGHALMIKGLVKKINPNARVFISGNNAFLVLDLLPNYKYIKEATIQGMKIIYSNR